MWDKGLVYEGHRVTPYCPRCGTALASHEVAQGYQDVVDPSAYVRFPITSGGPTEADLLVWTTTPWTLVSNVAVAAGPDIVYVQLRGAAPGRDLVLAEAAVDRHFGEGVGEVVACFTGRDLVGWHYDRPFTDLPLDEAAARVVVADYVTTTDGTGLVHTAPAFGEDDANTGRAEGLPVLNPVDADGAFDHTVSRLTGVFVKDADRTLLDDLAARGLLEREVPDAAQLPPLLALRHPAHLLGQDVVVRGTSEQREAMVRENAARRLASRAHQARALRQLARDERRLGSLARSLLGHSVACVAMLLAPRHVHRRRRRAVAARGARPRRPRPPPSLRR